MERTIVDFNPEEHSVGANGRQTTRMILICTLS